MAKISKHVRGNIMDGLNNSSNTMDRIIEEFQTNKRKMINEFGDLDKYDDLSTIGSDIQNALERINSMKFNLNALVSELEMLEERLLVAGTSEETYSASTKKSKMKKKSDFSNWMKNKLGNTISGVSVVDVSPGQGGYIITFELTNPNVTTDENDEECNRIVDRIYDKISYIGGVSDAGFNDVIDDRRFKWLVYDDRQDANYEASTKKSKPKTTMSFEDNVNKMRINNYARTGNINTVMKKRD